MSQLTPPQSLSRVIIRRAWFGHWVYPVLFCFSLLISLAAYLTLDTLQTAVDRYIVDNQKAMVGGDVIVRSRAAFPTEIQQWYQQQNPDDVVYDRQFNAMAYANEASLLVRVKGVDHSYPLYGALELASNKSLPDSLSAGHVLVERQVLTGLGLAIGDSLALGDSTFTVADEIIAEPDRPLTAFGFGARIMMLNTDLAATGLLGQRSRVNHRLEIRVADAELNGTLAELSALSQDDAVRISTVDESETSISALSANFLKFLKLLVVAVIVLSGVGLMSVVKAFVNRQQQSNAIRRAIGEPVGQLQRSYHQLFFMMTVLAVMLAWGISYLTLWLGYDAFSAIIPAEVTLKISWLSLVKVMLIALGLTWLMTHSTIQALAAVKPVAVLHQHVPTKPGWHHSKYGLLLSVIGLYALLSLEWASWWLGLQLTLGLLLLIGLFMLFSRLVLSALRWLIDRGWVSNWLLKLSLQNIFRKGNQSMLFFTTMSMAVMVMWSISALNHTIDEQLINTYPEDSPNMFMLDVQTDQHEELNAMVPGPITYYPVIRARIATVNGVDAETLKDQLGNYDNVTRVFNLSYGDSLLDTEFLQQSTKAEQLFDASGLTGTASSPVPISILDTIGGYLEISLHDEIVFDIQGVPIHTYVSSIRSRFQRGPSPFFYFMFQPEVMADAPQIQFATAQVAGELIPQLQTDVAKKFPGITTLDGASIAKQLKGFVDQLTQLVQIFTGLSVLAGVMILITSLVSTSQDRLQESAYFRLMGMLTKDLYAINIIELMLLGLLAFLAGSSLGYLVAYTITTYWFNLTFVAPWEISLYALLGLMTTLLVVSLVYGRFVIKSNVMKLVRAMV